MNLKEWLKDLSVAVFSSVLPALYAWIKDHLEFWPIVSMILFGITVFLSLQLWRAKRTPQPQSAEILPSSGIQELPLLPSENILELASSCTSSFYFLGVSGNRTANNNELLNKLAKLARSGGEVRFLLFDPESSQFELRASDEGVIPELWEKDIAATVLRLKSAAKSHRATFHIRYYEAYPIWRMIVLDRQIIRLNYFLDKFRLTDSPKLKLTHCPNGLQGAFLKQFDEMWQSAREA